MAPLPRTELSAQALHPLDFSGGPTTFVLLRDGQALSYTVAPRPLSVNVSSGLVHAERDYRRYTMRLRARSANGTVPAAITVADGPDRYSAQEIATIRVDTSFTSSGWGEVGSLSVELPTSRASKLWVSAVGGAVDLDWMVLVEDAAGSP